MTSLSELEIDRYKTALLKAQSEPSNPARKPLLDYLQSVIGLIGSTSAQPYFVATRIQEFEKLIRASSSSQFSDDLLFAIVQMFSILERERQYRSDFTDIDAPSRRRMLAVIKEHAHPERKIMMEYVDNRLIIDLMEFDRQKLQEKIKTQFDEGNKIIDELFRRKASELQSALGKVTSWEAELVEWGDRVSTLKKSYKDLYEKENFVGLAAAFSKLIDEKTLESRIQVGLLIMFGLILFAIPAHSAWLFSHDPPKPTVDLLLKVLPTALMELLIFYFFRIFLDNYYSIKAQILQMKLRHSLCAFIEGYAEFIKRIRTENDSKTLEKFEAQIFSGITLDPQKVPSQFDGLEKIIELIKLARPKAE